MSIFRKLLRPRRKRRYCAVLIAAAGSSRRMGGENKLFCEIGGLPVIAHTLLAADRASLTDEIVLAVREEELLRFADICKSCGLKKPVKVVVGGETRAESVLRAALEADPKTEFLAVQDGARPFVTPSLIDAVIETAYTALAAAPAIPVHDTIKIARDGIVCETPDRNTLFAVQTPQVFDAGLLKAALQSALTDDAAVTDDCSAVERLGKEIRLTEGDEENIKITTPTDLILAQAIWEKRGAET